MWPLRDRSNSHGWQRFLKATFSCASLPQSQQGPLVSLCLLMCFPMWSRDPWELQFYPMQQETWKLLHPPRCARAPRGRVSPLASLWPLPPCPSSLFFPFSGADPANVGICSLPGFSSSHPGTGIACFHDSSSQAEL